MIEMTLIMIEGIGADPMIVAPDYLIYLFPGEVLPLEAGVQVPAVPADQAVLGVLDVQVEAPAENGKKIRFGSFQRDDPFDLSSESGGFLPV